MSASSVIEESMKRQALIFYNRHIRSKVIKHKKKAMDKFKENQPYMHSKPKQNLLKMELDNVMPLFKKENPLAFDQIDSLVKMENFWHQCEE